MDKHKSHTTHAPTHRDPVKSATPVSPPQPANVNPTKPAPIQQWKHKDHVRFPADPNGKWPEGTGVVSSVDPDGTVQVQRDGDLEGVGGFAPADLKPV